MDLSESSHALQNCSKPHLNKITTQIIKKQLILIREFLGMINQVEDSFLELFCF